MQNRWYVIAILVPAVLLAWATIHVAMGESGSMALVPGGLTAALVWFAIRVGRSETFAPAKVSRWDSASTPELERWQTHHADQAPKKR